MNLQGFLQRFFFASLILKIKTKQDFDFIYVVLDFISVYYLKNAQHPLKQRLISALIRPCILYELQNPDLSGQRGGSIKALIEYFAILSTHTLPNTRTLLTESVLKNIIYHLGPSPRTVPFLMRGSQVDSSGFCREVHVNQRPVSTSPRQSVSERSFY